MRGTARAHRLPPVHTGITPAHAGNSRMSWQTLAPAGDHPRTCGEQARAAPSVMLSLGSPPHMRGTGSDGYGIPGTHRITPAHAGNRDEAASLWHFAQDHPRTCGEQLTALIQKKLLGGSPPHMRGTDGASLIMHFQYRITPAHAGNSHAALNHQTGL